MERLRKVSRTVYGECFCISKGPNSDTYALVELLVLVSMNRYVFEGRSSFLDKVVPLIQILGIIASHQNAYY